MRHHIAPLLLVVTLLPATAGAAPSGRPGLTARVSISTAGEEADAGVSFSPPRLSGDGRLVVFSSPASNLVPGDENEAGDVFLRDRVAGTTERLTVATGGGEPDGGSGSASISADGRMAAFASAATNLVPGDTNAKTDVFILDRETGEIRSATAGGNGASTLPLISADGRRVAFLSVATDLVAGDTNGLADTYLYDVDTGVTTLVSEGTAGAAGDGASAGTPAISGDGRFVAFNSAATNLVAGDANARTDTFVRDLQTGVTEIASVSSEERQTREAVFSAPSISADGRFVAFDTWSWQLVPLDTNGDVGPVFPNFAVGFDVYVRDRLAGTTVEVTVTSAGVESDRDSGYPQLSPDGRYVTFTTPSANLVPGDTAGQTDVFVHDLLTGATERVSVSATEEQGDGGSFLSTISDGGRVVAFQSAASNLIDDDANGLSDVYVRDRGAELDVVDATAARDGGGVRVVGRATFSGLVASAETDRSGDGTVGALGSDLIWARVVYRPELDDLLVRLQVTDLPELRDPRAQLGTAGTMGVVYGLELSVGGARFAARGSQRGAALSPRVRDPEAGTTHTPSSEETWRFELIACDQVCAAGSTVRVLQGGYGTSGDEVRFAIPLDALGLVPGSAVTQVEAYTAAGDAAATSPLRLDSVALPGFVLPATTVRLSADGGAVEVAVTSGGFVGILPGAPAVVQALACLGTCGDAVPIPVAG